MHYLIVSFSYKHAGLEVRERLSYDEGDKAQCLRKLLQSPSINEVILLTTCNRSEFIVNCSDVEDAKKHIFTILELKSGLDRSELIEHSDVFDDSMAIHHLFSVASSIDSMVVGETQIAGQLKDAFRLSHDNGFSDKKLSRAISHAFKCAAKVRNATDISSKPVSIASVALAAIKKETSLEGKRALVIGVGEMSEIVAKHLVSDGIETFITNRTSKKAEILGEECGANTYHYGDLDKAVNEFDIIFTATGSQVPIITEDMIESRETPRYWFDLAIPRDIETPKYNNIKLYVIDDLQEVVACNLADRKQYVRQAQAIIGRSVVEFFEWLDALNVEPIIKEIYQKAYDAAKIEAQRAVKKGFIPKEYEDNARKMSEQALKRFLHDMTKKMRKTIHEAKSDTVTGALQYILNDEKDNIPDKYKHLVQKDES